MNTLLKTLLLSAAIALVTPALANPGDADDRGAEDGRGHRGGPPDLTDAAAQLGITVEVLESALRESGGPPPNLAQAAATLGITEAELKAVMPPPPGRGERSRGL